MQIDRRLEACHSVPQGLFWRETLLALAQLSGREPDLLKRSRAV
jgi:hypothetical protein